MSKSTKPAMPKPLLRGYFHQEAFFVALGACALLVAQSRIGPNLIASMVYSLGLLSMLGVSAIYHRPQWSPKARALLRKLDHAAIYILIAGTATPIGLLALKGSNKQEFLILIWTLATAGVVQSIFWVHAPKFLSAIFYIIMGWMAMPYITELKEAMGATKTVLLLSGGVVYSLGALLYAIRRPRLVPHVFGYHEVFHILTIIGAILHFIVIYQLVG